MNNINSLDWEEFWSLKLSPFQCSLLGNMYTTSIAKIQKNSFSTVYIFTKKGHSSCFFKSNDRKNYAKELNSEYLKDVSTFCSDMKQKADDFREFMNQKEWTKEKYFEFKKIFDDYNRPYMFPRSLADYGNAEDVNEYFEVLQNMRLYAETLHQDVDKKMIKMIKSFIKEDYSEEILGNLTFVELESYFDSGNLPSVEELEKRSETVLQIHEKNSVKIVTDSTIEEIEKKLTESNEVMELKGTPAFKGIAKGPAKIIMNPSSDKEFNDGDILITGMTRPDFLPIMKKSSGIVTDLGGMLCHAAITARELGIPCLIGTKNATKIFKDGDLVEVDCDKGIIKKV